LYILGLLDRPTTGRYVISGTPTETLSDDERAKFRNSSMGFVFQSFHLLPRASALRNVMMPLAYASSYGQAISDRDQRERAERSLATVGLADRMNHLPNQLSGGQRQRVAIARAIVNDPSVLFADEPTGNLDSKVGGEIVALFERLNVEGVTVVMVTHDQAIAQRAKRRIVLGDGKLLAG
jgi:putative ABC transport system ATP-binding protein